VDTEQSLGLVERVRSQRTEGSFGIMRLRKTPLRLTPPPCDEEPPAERLASMEGRIALVMAMALMVLSSNMSRSTSSVVSSAAACCDPPATWNR
jgi:hypothetical protein